MRPPSLESSRPLDPSYLPMDLSYETQRALAKAALQEYIAELAKVDPQLAAVRSSQLTNRTWTKFDATQLRNQGVPIPDILIEPGLLGGMLEGAGEAIALLKGAIELIVNGNKAEIRERLSDQFIPARIQLPSGEWIEGQHEGGRTLSRPVRKCTTLWIKRYDMLACGNGKFHAKSVKYEGDFLENLFHDHTGNAVYYIAQDTRYTGCFFQGKRSGRGKLEKYDNTRHEFYPYFKGMWKEDSPYDGEYYSPDGQIISRLKDGIPQQHLNETSPPELPGAGVGIESIAVQITDDKIGQSEPVNMELQTIQQSAHNASSFVSFGKTDWERYFGTVDNEPPLPDNIMDILQGPCPICPGKMIQDTHILTFIPSSINGQPLTLDCLMELIKAPKSSGHATIYRRYDSEVKSQHGSKGLHSPTWVLMSRDIIPGSRNKSFDEQLQIVGMQGKQTPMVYEPPRVLEAAASILLHYAKTGQRLYMDQPYTYTRCQESISPGQSPIVVGGFSPEGLDISENQESKNYEGLGITRVLRFPHEQKTPSQDGAGMTGSAPANQLPSAPPVTLSQEKWIDCCKKLHARVVEIESKLGTVPTAIGEVLSRLPKNEKFKDFQALVNKLENSRMQAIEEYEQTRLFYERTQLFATEVDNFFMEAEENYNYFNYGFGQFEEYEIDDASRDAYLKTWHSLIDSPDIETTFAQVLVSEMRSNFTLLNSKLELFCKLKEEFDYSKMSDSLKELEVLREKMQKTLERARLNDDQTPQNLKGLVSACESADSEFEEYLSQELNSSHFLKELAKERVFKAIGDDGIRGFKSAYREWVENMDPFCDLLVKEDFEACLESLEDLEQSFEDLENSVDLIVNALDNQIQEITPYRYDEPKDPHQEAALSEATNRFSRFHKHITEQNKKNHEILITLQGVCCEGRIKSLKAIQEHTLTSENSLIKEFKKAKQLASQNFDPSEEIDVLAASVCDLIRRDELRRAEADMSFFSLMDRREKALKDCQNIVAMDVEDPIDTYIQYARLERRLEERRQTVGELARGFFDKIGRQFDGRRGVVVAKNEKGIFAQKVMKGSLCPIASPLVDLISRLSQMGIEKRLHKEFVYFLDRDFSRFERGVFKVFGIGGMDDKVCPGSVYHQHVHQLSPSEGIELQVEIAEYPEYYNRFRVSDLEKPAPIKWNQEMEQALTLLVVVIAFEFKDSSRRGEIPPGNPVGCIITSETGEILSWGVNSIGEKGNDLIRHAETNAIYAFFKHNPDKATLHQNARIFTSLSPCAMCSGALQDASVPVEAPLDIVYAQTDPGQKKCIENLSMRTVNHPVISSLNATYDKIKKENPGVNAAACLLESAFDSVYVDAKEALRDLLKKQQKVQATYLDYLLEVCKSRMGIEIWCPDDRRLS